MGMKELLETLARERAASLAMGGPEAVNKQHALGRLTARERVMKLFDSGTFVELGMLARAQDPALDAISAADGLVTGLGKINGTGAALIAEDATVLDNTNGQVAGIKRARLLDVAAKTGWALLLLADRGEGRIAPSGVAPFGTSAPQTPELQAGRWPNLALAAVMGNCFGASAAWATAADFLVMVKGACLQLEGPAQSGENVKFHAEDSGVVDSEAQDDDEALALLKQFIGYLPANNNLLPPRVHGGDSPERMLAEAQGLVPQDLEQPYDVLPLVRMLVDRDSFFPLKPNFAPNLVTGLARLDGHTIGVIASQPLHNRGVVDGAAVRKALSLAKLCRRFRLPVLFIQDSPGYAAMSPADERDLLLATKELVQTALEVRAPKLALILRRGHALGEFALGGRKLGIDYIAAWPLAEVPTVEPVGFSAKAAVAAGERKGPWPAADAAIIDDILEPGETRQRLAQMLELGMVERDLVAGARAS
jgi:acetyl-CoA carboxylase carboxyltransferase component